ncbi:hypothetical protein BST97_01575 [Nonlabens spongiae]|uniref:DUF4836 domain-containing protein n=1 Tax=Nonlabens spongiae TaxID=331648 RepID=A0A1W6MGS3_9FLAO|nr:DUF4836 family protein [Nonlabens spongiae]ARN76795.1 hypothetical protein BST97_01575 [Nonlabens spongiae]
MKKLFYFFSIILIGTSCSEMTDASALVPDSANYVAVIDVKSLVEKAELNDKAADMSSIEAFENELENQDARVYRLYQDIKEDPLKAGVNLRDPIVIFNVMEENNTMVGIAMDAWDGEDFGNTIKTLFSSMKMNLAEKEMDGYTYLWPETRSMPFGVAYDDDRILMLYGAGFMLEQENLDTTMATLMNGNTTFKSENDLFDDFMGDRGDISLFTGTSSYSEIMGSMVPISSVFSKDLLEYLDDNYSMIHLNFEDDKIEMLSKAVYNDKLMDKMDEMGVEASEIDQDMLKYLPKDGMAVMGMSVEVSGILDAVREFMGEDEKAKKEFEEGVKKYEIETLLEAIEFNMAVVFNDIVEKESPYAMYGNSTQPSLDYAAIMKINDRDRIVKFLEKDVPEPMPKEGNLYNLDNQYLSVGEESMMLTSDRNLAEHHFNSKTPSSSLAGSDSASKMGSTMFYASMDLDLKKVTFLDNSIPQQARPIATMWDDFLVKIEVEQDDITENRATLYVADSGKNSLARIIELAEESYQKMTQVQ